MAHRDLAHASRAWQQLSDQIVRDTVRDASHDTVHASAGVSGESGDNGNASDTDTASDIPRDTPARADLDIQPHLHHVVTWLQSGPQQRLMPMLSSRSAALRLPGLVDMACEEATAIGWGMNVRIIEAIEPVITAWRRAGIDALAMKGLGLIGDAHLEHRYRPLGDADLLVPEHRLDDAFEVLAQHGWYVAARHRWHLAGRGTAVNIGNGSGVSIDVHRRTARTMPVEQQRDLWLGAEPLPAAHPLAATGLHRLGPVQHALALVAHASGSDALPHVLADLHLHLVAHPTLGTDHDTVAAALARHHLTARAVATLAALHSMLGTPLPVDLVRLDPRPGPVEARIIAADTRLAAPRRTSTAARRAADYVRITGAGGGPGAHLAALGGVALRATVARLDRR